MQKFGFSLGSGKPNIELEQTPLEKYLSENRNEARSGSDTLRIASFNIQVFGVAKMKRPEVVNSLIRIIDNFDIVAIQEIRDKSGEGISMLMDILGSDWDYSKSKPIGRSRSKEQYAFIYRVDKVSSSNCQTWPDPKDLLHREPHICDFISSSGFKFTIINIHTDPDIVDQEINVLDDVYLDYSDKENLILLGDFNASPAKFDELASVKDIQWAIDQGTMTNTRATKNYDNILYRYTELEEIYKSYVFDMQKRLGITFKEALRVSDHNPVAIELVIPEKKAA
ncbi:MAG: hypothetical protein Kapaf2KO_20160 [Candidatus Kapaibacteriales bacterium]